MKKLSLVAVLGIMLAPVSFAQSGPGHSGGNSGNNGGHGNGSNNGGGNNGGHGNGGYNGGGNNGGNSGNNGPGSNSPREEIQPGFYSSTQGTRNQVIITKNGYITYAQYMNNPAGAVVYQGDIGTFYSPKIIRITQSTRGCFTLLLERQASDNLCLSYPTPQQPGNGNGGSGNGGYPGGNNGYPGGNNQPAQTLAAGVYRSANARQVIISKTTTGATFAKYNDYSASPLNMQFGSGTFSSGSAFNVVMSSPGCFTLIWGTTGSDTLCAVIPLREARDPRYEIQSGVYRSSNARQVIFSMNQGVIYGKYNDYSASPLSFQDNDATFNSGAAFNIGVTQTGCITLMWGTSMSGVDTLCKVGGDGQMHTPMYEIQAGVYRSSNARQVIMTKDLSGKIYGKYNDYAASMINFDGNDGTFNSGAAFNIAISSPGCISLMWGTSMSGIDTLCLVGGQKPVRNFRMELQPGIYRSNNARQVSIVKNSSQAFGTYNNYASSELIFQDNYASFTSGSYFSIYSSRPGCIALLWGTSSSGQDELCLMGMPPRP